MSGIIDAIQGVVEDIFDEIQTIAEVLWEDIVIPALGEIVGIFGIEDETVIQIEHVSVRLYNEDLSGFRDRSITKTALSYMRNPKSGLLLPFIANTEEASSKVEGYFDFGLNNYSYALPTTDVQGAALDLVAVADAIETDIGEAVTILSAKQYYVTADEYYKYFLQENHSYLPYANTLTYTDYLGTWDTYVLTSIVYDAGDDEYDITITRPPETPETEPHIEVLNEIPWNVTTYITAIYYTVASGDPDIWFYWVYDLSTEVYPEFEAITTNLTQLEMMPIAILRKDFADVSPANVGQAEFDSIIELVNTLGINFDDLMSQIADPANPNIDELKDAFLHFSADPADVVPEISKVLFEMWFSLTQVGGVFTETTPGSPPDNTQNYIATFSEQDINRAMVWSNQEFYDIPEVIGPLNTYAHYQDTYFSYTTEIDDDGDPYQKQHDNTRLYLQKQVTPTDVAYIILHNLSTVEFIYAGGTWNTNASKLGEANFSIPLSHFAVNKLTFMEMLVLYPYVLRVNFYAVLVTELDWYETQAFANLFFIGLLILAIITFDPEVLTFSAVLVEIVLQYVIYAVAVALIESIDNDFLKLVVAATAVYLSFKFSSTTDGFFTAEQMTLSVTEFAGYLTADFAFDIEQTQDALEDLRLEGTTRLEQIEALNRELNNDSAPEGIFIASLNSPNTLMYRAIQIQYDFSNVYDYDNQTTNFHENALTLGVV